MNPHNDFDKEVEVEIEAKVEPKLGPDAEAAGINPPKDPALLMLASYLDQRFVSEFSRIVAEQATEERERLNTRLLTLEKENEALKSRLNLWNNLWSNTKGISGLLNGGIDAEKIRTSLQWKNRPLGLSFSFLVFVSIAALFHFIPSFVFWLYIVMSGVAFGLYLIDRIIYKVLEECLWDRFFFLAFLLGGWPGGVLGRSLIGRGECSDKSRGLFVIATTVNLIIFFASLFR